VHELDSQAAAGAGFQRSPPSTRYAFAGRAGLFASALRSADVAEGVRIASIEQLRGEAAELPAPVAEGKSRFSSS
jgi:hypothetical protein